MNERRIGMPSFRAVVAAIVLGLAAGSLAALWRAIQEGEPHVSAAGRTTMEVVS